MPLAAQLLCGLNGYACTWTVSFSRATFDDGHSFPSTLTSLLGRRERETWRANAVPFLRRCASVISFGLEVSFKTRAEQHLSVCARVGAMLQE